MEKKVKILRRVIKKKKPLKKEKIVERQGTTVKINRKKLAKNIGHVIKIKTGIPNFDHLVNGGFNKNSTNVLVGGAGSGKSILCTQFLIEGMKNGEKCLYITFEENKVQFYENMKEFWDLEAYEKKDLLTFLEYTPIKVKTMLERGGGAIESIILKKRNYKNYNRQHEFVLSSF